MTNFDISTIAFFQSFSVLAQTGIPTGMTWNNDGSKMYVNDLSSIFEYNLSTNFDISTAVFLQSFSVAAQGTTMQDISWNLDGSKMYVIDANGSSVFEYNLSTNFDISTAVFFQSFSVLAQSSAPTGMAWNNDGSKMYTVSDGNNSVHEYNLSTNFDISTAVFFQSFSVAAQDTNPTGITWNNDGSKIYVVGFSNGSVYEYNLSTNFDISTAVFLQSFDVLPQDNRPQDITWNNDGSKMYVIGSTNDSIHQYNTTVPRATKTVTANLCVRTSTKANLGVRTSSRANLGVRRSIKADLCV